MASLVLPLDVVEPNPYRGLNHGYKLQADRVEALKASFERTGYWQNVVVREHPDKPGIYQMSHGHHRVEALREEGVDKATFIVMSFDEGQMLKSMADENSDLYNLDTEADITALHSLLEGWATSIIDGYVVPGGKGKGPAHKYLRVHGPEQISYTREQVRAFFGWGERRARAAIAGLEHIATGDFEADDFSGLSARAAYAATQSVKDAERKAKASGLDKKDAKKVKDAAVKAVKSEIARGRAPGATEASDRTIKEKASKAIEATVAAVLPPPPPPDILPNEIMRGIANEALKLEDNLSRMIALGIAHPEVVRRIHEVTGGALQPDYFRLGLTTLSPVLAEALALFGGYVEPTIKRVKEGAPA